MKDLQKILTDVRFFNGSFFLKYDNFVEIVRPNRDSIILNDPEGMLFKEIDRLSSNLSPNVSTSSSADQNNSFTSNPADNLETLRNLYMDFYKKEGPHRAETLLDKMHLHMF